ncbi:MAG: hypothetical protein ACR2MF_07260, partial [Chthoniobacterales bacterium]
EATTTTTHTILGKGASCERCKAWYEKRGGRETATESTDELARRLRGKRKVTRKNPARKFHPPYNVQVNQERDNFDIWLSDRDDKDISHWSDDDARSMIEDGFFSNKGGKKLADSVVEYAREVGLIN